MKSKNLREDACLSDPERLPNRNSANSRAARAEVLGPLGGGLHPEDHEQCEGP